MDLTSKTLSKPFEHVEGYCWAISLPASAYPDWDDPSDPSRSSLVVSENGVDLGPPHTAHQLIAKEGAGAFSYWNGVLRFSAADNTDPNANGRVYAVRQDAGKYFRSRVKYSVDIVRSWTRRLPGGMAGVRDKVVLEIGPGRDMGTVFILAALGARAVVAVDRFRGVWQDEWHDPFLRELNSALREFEPAVVAGVIDQALEARRLDIGPVSFFAEPLEEMGARLRGTIDISVSHSVFEHFYSVSEAAAALALAMRRGGIGVHNVDFRDHRNFGSPLEFLVEPDDEYARPESNDQYGRGNRVRPWAMSRMLAHAGFEHVSFVPDQLADDAYLAEIEKRLATAGSSFRGTPGELLRVVSGTFLLTR